jgi:hypothetical protein
MPPPNVDETRASEAKMARMRHRLLKPMAPMAKRHFVLASEKNPPNQVIAKTRNLSMTAVKEAFGGAPAKEKLSHIRSAPAMMASIVFQMFCASGNGSFMKNPH